MSEVARVQKLYDTHKQLSTICAKMNTRGFYFREDNRQFMVHCLREEIAEKVSYWRNVAQISDKVASSPHTMRALLFGRHRKAGIPCADMPDPVNKPDFTNATKETISVKKAPLLRLLVSPQATPEVTRLVDAWWGFKKAEKRLSMLESEKMLADVDKETGRIRPPWNSCGTDTGRFSGGYWMTLPAALRHIAGPAPGKSIIHVDKSQLEIRVMACVADDVTLQNVVKSGKDLYTEEAKEYFSLPADTTKKTILTKHRQGAKIVRLARQYGAQEKTCFSQAIAQDRTVTITLMRALIAKFDTRYHRTVSYWGEETKRVARDGYSESRLLRRRRSYPRMPDLAEIANWPIQSTASDIMNQEFIELDYRLEDKFGDRAYIIGQFHDAIDIECDEDIEAEVTALVMEVTNRNWVVNGVDFPFHVDTKIARHSNGDTWAKCA